MTKIPRDTYANWRGHKIRTKCTARDSLGTWSEHAVLCDGTPIGEVYEAGHKRWNAMYTDGKKVLSGWGAADTKTQAIQKLVDYYLDYASKAKRS